MKLPIHTYCLTVPGSARHKKMYKQLVQKCPTFEFIFSDAQDVDPPLEHIMTTPYWRHVLDKYGQVDHATLDAVERSWKCKAGMIHAMKKIADDDLGWSLFLQDDVILLDNWIDRAEEVIKEAPAHMDRIVCTRISDIYKRNMIHANNSSYCTETAMLLTPEFAKRYIRANGISHVESDLAPLTVDGVGNFLFPGLFAVLACTPSTIANG